MLLSPENDPLMLLQQAHLSPQGVPKLKREPVIYQLATWVESFSRALCTQLPSSQPLGRGEGGVLGWSSCLQPESLGDGSSSLSTGGHIGHYLYDNSIRRQQLPQLMGGEESEGDRQLA